jgi:two-component sensor histidine kinase
MHSGAQRHTRTGNPSSGRGRVPDGDEPQPASEADHLARLPDTLLDSVAALLADPPADIARRYLEILRDGAGVTEALLLDGRDGVVQTLGAADVPPATFEWLSTIAGDGIAAPPADLFGVPALAAHRSGEGVSTAVVLLGISDAGAAEATAALEAIARFAPAVLRHAAGQRAKATADAERLEEFGRASPDAFWIFSADTLRAEYMSPAFAVIHGRVVADALAAGDGADADVEPDDSAAALGSAERAAGGAVGVVEFRIRRAGDGALRWIRATDFPLRGPTGRIERVGRIARDVTESREAGEESRRLQRELQHRVRNALGVIRALVRRTAETSETLEDLASHLDGRINAFARVQSALARNPSAGLDLELLLSDEILTSSVQEPGRVTLKGPAVSLTPKAAETLGLILHELATNALEHGALGTRKGRLKVTWEVRPDRDVPRLVLEWVERGPARDGPPPTHRGFGTELLEKTLPYELNGSATVTWERQGLRCVLEVPLTPLVLARSV